MGTFLLPHVFAILILIVGFCHGLTTSWKATTPKKKVLFVDDLRPSAIIGTVSTLLYDGENDDKKDALLGNLLTKKLAECFGQYGKIDKLGVHGIQDYRIASLRKQKRKRRPYAFVTFSNEGSAELALDSNLLNQTLFRKIGFSTVPDSWRKKPLPIPQNASQSTAAQEVSVLKLLQRGELKMDMILQVNKSHLHRVLDYIQAQFSTNATITGYVQSITCRKTLSLVFLHVNNRNDDTSVISFLEDVLAPDPFIHKGLNAVYIVHPNITHRICKSEEDVCLAAFRMLEQEQELQPTRVKVQAFPPKTQDAVLKSLRHQLQQHKAHHIEISPSDNTHVLSVVRLENQESNDTIFLWGVEKAWKASIGDGHAAPKSDVGDVSRAYYKLKEALERSISPADYRHSILVRSNSSSLTAIDCGASPGGWTKFLALDFDCETVYSVDPGQLDPSVAKLPGVVHLPIKTETAIQQFAEQGVRLDIWVSDMCLHDMNRQIDMLKDAIGAGIVRKNALFCLTLKCTTGHSKSAHDKQVALAIQRLDGIASNINVLHLFSNRNGERTVVGLVV